MVNLPLANTKSPPRLPDRADRCRAERGRQDQYAATFGGVNFMEFHPQNRVIVNPLRVKNWIMSEFETSLVLFNSGVSAHIGQHHPGADGQSDQSTNSTTLDAMHAIKADAIGMKNAC